MLMHESYCRVVRAIYGMDHEKAQQIIERWRAWLFRESRREREGFSVKL